MSHKTYYYLLFCLSWILTINSTSAQYSYYFDGELVNLEVNQDKILIGLEKGQNLSLNNVRRLESNVVQSGTLRDHIVLAIPNKSESERKSFINSIQRFSEVQFVHPFFLFPEAPSLSYEHDILFKRNENVSKEQFRKYCQGNGWAIKQYNTYRINSGIIQADGADALELFEMARKLYEDGLVAYAEPNFIGDNASMYVPNDPELDNQFPVDNDGSVYGGGAAGVVGADMRLEEAWDFTRGCSDIVIAIIDEGVNLNHPDLMGNLIGGYDATDENDAGASENGDSHGSFCAGTAAAVGDNGIGVAGVAYECSIMPIRAWETGDGSTSYFVDAFDWAWNNGADVISNSWGWSSSGAIQDAIDDAIEFGRDGKGCIVLASSGNNNNGSTLGFPARYGPVISVGASNACDERKSSSSDTTGCDKSSLIPDPVGVSCDNVQCWGSSYGNNLDIVAPGQYVRTTSLNGYAWFQGTSAACPNAAGVAALILSVNPDLSETGVKNILEQTCRKGGSYTYNQQVGHPNGDWNNQMGYGIVNAQAAVVQAMVSASAYLQNVTYPAPWGFLIQKRVAIFAGNFVNFSAPPGNVNVANGATLNLNAQKFISLRPGFRAFPGSVMEAKIVSLGGCPVLD